MDTGFAAYITPLTPPYPRIHLAIAVMPMPRLVTGAFRDGRFLSLSLVVLWHYSTRLKFGGNKERPSQKALSCSAIPFGDSL